MAGRTDSIQIWLQKTSTHYRNAIPLELYGSHHQVESTEILSQGVKLYVDPVVCINVLTLDLLRKWERSRTSRDTRLGWAGSHNPCVHLRDIILCQRRAILVLLVLPPEVWGSAPTPWASFQRPGHGALRCRSGFIFFFFHSSYSGGQAAAQDAGIHAK